MKIALVYDRVNKWGGAERVLLTLHELFPNAPLYTSVYHKKRAPWAKVFDVRTSFLQKFPLASRFHQLYALLMPLAFERFSFEKYDVVISVTSESAKGIITEPDTKHICYCLTPTRYIWSGYDEYFKNPVFRLLTKPLVTYLRFWDKKAAERVDTFIAISEEVKQRINKYYGRESQVIFPPTQLLLTKQKKNKALEEKLSAGKYFLVVSRLVPYKRIELAIKACNRLQLPLKIIGTGSENTYLKTIAGKTVEFIGSVSDAELYMYYKHAKALIFPGKEDFGLSIVEAQACGIPVIAYGKGGAEEIVLDGKTGILFDSQTISSLIDAIEKLGKKRFDPKKCKEQAKKFGLSEFKKQFLPLI
jgi:glycosyltransferase involved in cell wall biosynthesis